MTKEELEIWTRFACAAVHLGHDVRATPPVIAGVAGAMLDQWRERRNAIEAAEREAEAARVRAAEAERAEANARAEAARVERIAAVEAAKRQLRERLNAARWEPSGVWHFFRRAGTATDQASQVDFGWILYPASGSVIRLAPAAEWPADMGNPPPGWGAP